MAIDYGAKRVGIAVTDPLRIIATGLTTVESVNAIQFIRGYIKKEQVDEIIVGYPLDLRGMATDATPLVDKFIQQLNKYFNQIQIIKWDEAFTSKRAMKALIDSGVKKKERRNKSLIDKISAVIILQEYLQSL